MENYTCPECGATTNENGTFRLSRGWPFSAECVTCRTRLEDSLASLGATIARERERRVLGYVEAASDGNGIVPVTLSGGAKAPSYPPNRKTRPDGTPNQNYRPGSVKPKILPPPPPRKKTKQ